MFTHDLLLPKCAIEKTGGKDQEVQDTRVLLSKY